MNAQDAYRLQNEVLLVENGFLFISHKVEKDFSLDVSLSHPIESLRVLGMREGRTKGTATTTV